MSQNFKRIWLSCFRFHGSFQSENILLFQEFTSIIYIVVYFSLYSPNPSAVSFQLIFWVPTLFNHLPLLCQFFQLVNTYFGVIFLYSNNSAYRWPLYHYSWSCFMYVISSWVFLRLMIRMFKNVSFVLEWPLLSSS